MAATMSSTHVADISSSAPRRKSGRVSRKPEHFIPASSPAGSAKRKRSDEPDEDAGTVDTQSEEEEDESSEGEPDEEELKERRKRIKKKAKAAPRKPAPKKPKTNGEPVTLAIRPATAKPRPKKRAPARKSAVAEDAEGLYGRWCVAFAWYYADAF